MAAHKSRKNQPQPTANLRKPAALGAAAMRAGEPQAISPMTPGEAARQAAMRKALGR